MTSFTRPIPASPYGLRSNPGHSTRQFRPPVSSSRSSIRSFAAELRLVAAHLLDEPLRILAADEHLEFDPEREVGRERVVDDGVDDHRRTMTLPTAESQPTEHSSSLFDGVGRS